MNIEQPHLPRPEQPRPVSDLAGRFDASAGDAGIREACDKLAAVIDEAIPNGREKSTAITKIEEAMFWAEEGIRRPK